MTTPIVSGVGLFRRRTTAPVVLLIVTIVLAAGAGASLLVATRAVPTVMAIHGALMIVAWGALLPLGGLVARYFKVTPAQDFPAALDNPFWWNAHRLLQYSGIAVATAGMGVILSATGGRFDTLHGRCGLLVMSVAWLQVASPLMRGSKGGPTDAGARRDQPETWRGDHYDMTRRRRLFEAWHRPAGWGSIALGGVTLVLGADLAGAPGWLFGLLGLTEASLVMAMLDCRLRRRWVDTWVAHWGPAPGLPGRAPEPRLDAAGPRPLDRAAEESGRCAATHATALRGGSSAP